MKDTLIHKESSGVECLLVQLFFFLINMHIGLLLLCLMILTGCTERTAIFQNDFLQDERNQQELSGWPDFSLQSDVQFTQKIIGDDGSIALINYDNRTTYRNPGDVLLEQYRMSDACPLIEGAQAETIEGAGGNAFWGKMMPASPFTHPRPLCQPPILEMDKRPDLMEKDPSKYGTAYALCSEKDGKSVVICIGQITDNPTLAKEVFETFRWNE